MRKLRSSLFAGIVIALVSLITTTASAQLQNPKAEPFDMNYVKPAVRPDDGFTITRPNDLGHLGFSVSGILNYGYAPQTITTDNKKHVLISNSLSANLGLSFGLFERMSIDVLIPFNILIQDNTPQNIWDKAGLNRPGHPTILGDIQAGVRGRLYGSNDDLLSVGMYAGVVAPTANIMSGVLRHKEDPDCSTSGQNGKLYCQYYQGYKSFGARATVLFEYRPLDRLNLDANLGVTYTGGKNQLYKSNKNPGIINDPIQLNFALGGSYALLEEKNLVLYAEAIGNVMGFNFDGDKTAVSIFSKIPITGLVGAKYTTNFGLTAGLAAGGALTNGYGGATPRILLNVGWTMPGDPDTDGDGFKDSVDKCPNDPEDFDGFEDADGCPETDNDNDGIPDELDKCPLEAEDLDGFEDGDGCPEADNDNDGILDADDNCPLEAGVAAKQGCPVRDADGDGIEDDLDKCPSEPEDKDGFQDQDGCPEADNDGDGVLDANDKCPLEPGPVAKQGCPIKDKDNDGIPDDVDKCPDQPETYNGIKDEDGCPDGKAKVVVTKTQVQITETVYFASGKSTIKKKSYKLLNTVAEVLNKYEQITKLRVAGYTDNVGDPAKNLALSKERAKAVLDYLVSKGVAPDRLISEGYGENDPICKDIPELTKTKKDARRNRRKIKACQAANRRVEFQVLELNNRPVDASSSVTVVEKEEKVEN